MADHLVEDRPWKETEAVPGMPNTTLTVPASPTHLLKQPPRPSTAPHGTATSILPQPAPREQTRKPLTSHNSPLPELPLQGPGPTQVAPSFPLPMAVQGYYTQAFILCNKRANNPHYGTASPLGGTQGTREKATN